MKHLRKKPKRKTVTLIAGIVCKDGIVVASDSQTTWGSGKRYDANKMTEIKYRNGRSLVAESGATVTSAALVDELKQLAQDKDGLDSSSLGPLSELAVRKVRDRLRRQSFDCTSEELQSFIERNELDCELMIADYHGSKPRITTVSLSLGIPNTAQSYFETIGSGSDLATYLLTDLCTPDLDRDTASLIAVLVVEIVKRHDPYCGGPAKLGICRGLSKPIPLPEYLESEEERFGTLPPGYAFSQADYFPPIIVSEADTLEIVKMVADVELQTKISRRDFIRDTLIKFSEKSRLKEMLEAYN